MRRGRAREGRLPRRRRPHHLRAARTGRRGPVRAPGAPRDRAGGRRARAGAPFGRGGRRHARLLPPRGGAGAAAADVQRDPAGRARGPDRRHGPAHLRRRARDRQGRCGRARVRLRAHRAPGAARGADRRGCAHRPRRDGRRRRRLRPALLGDHVAAEGHHALQQHAALRDRAHHEALAAHAGRREPRRLRVRLRRRRRCA
jgi:hypothetical protein